MKKIVFRTDGGKKIGLGHIMRCIALAKEFRSREYEILFIVNKDDTVKSLLLHHSFRYIEIIENEYETSELSLILKTENAKVIILDTFRANQEYTAQLRECIPHSFIVLLDNLREGKGACNLLINGSVYAKDFYNEYLNDKSYLLGAKYSILREEYRTNNRKNIKDNVEKILITMGGTDVNHLTPKIIKLLNHVSAYEIQVLVGKGFDNRKEIELASNNDSRVKLIVDETNIKPYIEDSDFVISAGGTTIYELAATGTPSIIFLQAENQRLPATVMSENNCMISLDYYIDADEQKYLKIIKEVIKNKNCRLTMSKNLQSLIDGKGPQRIVKSIEQSINTWSDTIEFK